MRIRVSTTIDAPPEVVWEKIEDIGTHVTWMADAESIAFLTQRTRGVDTTFVCVTRIGPFRTRDVMTITEWSPGRAMGIVHEGLFRGDGRFTLAGRHGGNTRFTWRERLQFPWWLGGALGALVAKPILRHVWKKNLRRLKAHVEP